MIIRCDRIITVIIRGLGLDSIRLSDNGTEYGMTEFIVEDGAKVTVEFTETTKEFLNSITSHEEK